MKIEDFLKMFEPFIEMFMRFIILATTIYVLGGLVEPSIETKVLRIIAIIGGIWTLYPGLNVLAFLVDSAVYTYFKKKKENK